MMTAMTVIVVMVAAMTVMMRVDIGVGSVEEDPMVVGGVFQVDVAVHLGIEVTQCLRMASQPIWTASSKSLINALGTVNW